MKFPCVDYKAPSNLAEACELMADEGARPLAGGQSLLPLMAFRLARPEALVDLNRVSELAGVTTEAANGETQSLVIGAVTTHAEIKDSEVVASVLPVLATVASQIGHPPIRNLGTIGGSVAHADPAAEWPATCLALGAEAEICSVGRSRRELVGHLIAGPFETTLGEDEILCRLRFPVRPGRKVGVAEIAHRAGDFALAGAICVLDLVAGTWAGAITLFGVKGRPTRVELEASLLAAVSRGGDPGDLVTSHVLPQLGELVEDMHADAGFRRHLAGVAAKRAIVSAFQSGK
jgi:aerobic carbon-monoxide dehydrogenase medium subunit